MAAVGWGVLVLSQVDCLQWPLILPWCLPHVTFPSSRWPGLPHLVAQFPERKWKLSMASQDSSFHIPRFTSRKCYGSKPHSKSQLGRPVRWASALGGKARSDTLQRRFKHGRGWKGGGTWLFQGKKTHLLFIVIQYQNIDHLSHFRV